MIKRLYVFAENSEIAFQYMKALGFVPHQYVIVHRVEDVLAVDAEYDQIRAVGEYWKNQDVSFAYDELMYQIKRKICSQS